MKKIIFLILFVLFGLSVKAQEKKITINGQVSDSGMALQSVNIQVLNTEIGTQTDKGGKYTLTANVGDIIKFSYLGYYPVEIIMEDVDRTMNINMVLKVNELDAVTVTKKKRRKSQDELFKEYNTNPNLIKTTFGIIDKENSSTSLYILDEEDFPPGAVFLSQLLNLMPSFRPTTSMNTVTTPLFEIDGMLYQNPPLYMLDIPNIKRIATTSSLAATTKYGSMASGGLIIINTKTGNFSPGANGIPFYDQAKLRNNTYENDAIDSKATERDIPEYLIKLKLAQNEIEAKLIYENQLKVYSNSFHFILNAYDYFYSRWKNVKFSDSIIINNLSTLENNPNALKALAYTYQVQRRFQRANEIYKTIYRLRPNYIQSYLDLAISYIDIKEYKKAVGILTRYGYLIEEEFLSPNEKSTIFMERELKNLLSLHATDILSKSEAKNVNLDDAFDGTRLVFEWNDSEAEFSLQFVNPKGNYFKSERSVFADSDRIRDEKISGFSSEEFLIDDSMQGIWLVNATYLGNKSLTPSYIKVTIYHNYGSSSQHKEIKLFKLNSKNVNQQLFKVSNAVTSFSN